MRPGIEAFVLSQRMEQASRAQRAMPAINAMSDPADCVVLLDVDNTLLDNDAVQSDLSQHLETAFGASSRDRYWALFEALREEVGYADYLGTLQRYRALVPNDSQLLLMSAFLMDYPFPQRLYPGAMAAVAHLGTVGPTVILSDGDVVFQPRKIARSGLWDAVDGRVLIYIHKEHMLASVAELYPARHYVLIDDKLRILDAVKRQWGGRVTSVFVRQGHYAQDTQALKAYRPADVSIERIGDLTAMRLGDLARIGAR